MASARGSAFRGLCCRRSSARDASRCRRYRTAPSVMPRALAIWELDCPLLFKVLRATRSSGLSLTGMAGPPGDRVSITPGDAARCRKSRMGKPSRPRKSSCHLRLRLAGFMTAVRRMRTAMSRRGKRGRKKKRGRKNRKAKKAAARRGPTVKEKAYFVFKHRYLIVKRRENFTESDHDNLKRVLEYLPELATLRRFAERIYWVFDTPKGFHQSSCRRAAVLGDPAFQAVPELVKAMEQLDEERFPKLMAYLNNPISQRVRTNNHVERTNRMFRLLEKVRYKWRRRRTLVRFVVLKLDEVWSHWAPSKTKPKKSVTSRTTQPHVGQGTRRVA